jgi:acetyl-CoA carboxylase, biotin carboxylase subunit
VLLKASAGGGGRGMRIVREPVELRALFEQASAEAREAFGDGRLFLERFLENARHVEVQVLGDRHGSVVHLGERDCSLQRRHQKIVEEAPAPGISEPVRERIRDAALRFARAIAYDSAGTVEFLYDADAERFSFLEMNTRIQVEHPVTEEVTGIDLVAAQIRVAAGEPLPFAQGDVRIRGHAVECRVNVEDPDRDFLPSPGRITRWCMPEGAGIRVDTHGYEGYLVPPFYDSLLAKVIGRGEDRASAIAATLGAIERTEIGGVTTNLELHRFLLAHPDFGAARVSTRWLETTALPRYRERRRLAS